MKHIKIIYIFNLFDKYYLSNKLQEILLQIFSDFICIYY